MFPIEIWEKILHIIKRPEDLEKLKLVCKDWNMIIENIFDHHISWDNLCSKEITEKCMFHLVNQINEQSEYYNYDIVRSSNPMKYNKIWQEVYYYWKSWSLFIDHQVFIDKLSSLSSVMTFEKITHIDVYRNYLGIVTSENSILFYDISDLENIYHKVYNSTSAIAQFTFWRTENGDILALIRSITGDIKFWDVMSKTEGVYDNRGDFISVCLEKCYIIRDLNVTRVIYNKTVPALIPNSDHVALQNSTEDSEFLWKFGSSYYLSYNLFTLEENQSIRTNAKFHTLDKDLIVAISDKKIWFYLNGWCGINKWREYNLFNKLHGKIEYLCYHCNLLIFGLDSGTIYIFHLKEKSDLDSFDFSPSNGRKVIVDTKPIIAIRVIDFKKRKIIMAATDENVFLINFLSV